MYDPVAIEEKWLKVWQDNQLFLQTEKVDDTKEKIYLLFAFAYPSGSGLHVGHVESKTALDIVARYYRMNDKQVFFPVGWDAFGLPAENYAIKTGVHPQETTKNAIHTFRRQIKRLGISYDWANELATNHPEYYKWTQWIFLQLYKKGLAYQKQGSVNWCSSCKTVLANEQVVNGLCERCDTQVEQKSMKQWYYKITEYKDELIEGLTQVDWPKATKQQQLNWIGRSSGAIVSFSTQTRSTLDVYTTAHDTIYGCTFMVVAPEHQFIKDNQAQIKNWQEVAQYLDQAKKKTELERQAQKEKTGVRLEGVTVVNPVNGQEVPVFVADYVLLGYGTGAIMAVPAHDARDYAFAKKYSLPVVPVVRQKGQEVKEFINYSEIKLAKDNYQWFNSQEFDGLSYQEARAGILAKLIKMGKGRAETQYRLRDWLISRQRYWGTPIPVVYDPEGNPHLVKEEHLPWQLPTDVDFKPTGESPLKSSKEFIKRTEDLYGKGWRPEFDTMDTFVDSSWYFLRYVDSRNTKEFADGSQLDHWLPVDLYMIGPEHIVLHLLYARFFTKFLHTEGYLKFSEPFSKMRHQGMILGPDNKKMSKSKGNVINPDEIIKKFGADTLRVYEMFMGPLEADKPWNTRAVIGVYKFLQKLERLVTNQELDISNDTTVTRKLHQLIKKAGSDVPNLKFNTTIAFMMEFVNSWQELVNKKKLTISVNDRVKFVKVLALFAPFLADELYSFLTKETEQKEYHGVHLSSWPEYDEKLAKDEVLTIPVQVNGKVRGELELEVDSVDDEALVLQQATALATVQKYLADKEITKQIYIKGKIVSLVVR